MGVTHLLYFQKLHITSCHSNGRKAKLLEETTEQIDEN